MACAPDRTAPPPQTADSPYKSRDGWARVWQAARYSAAGLRAAVRHEAAFRQELLVGVPLVVVAWWVAKTPLQGLTLAGVIVLVWVAELLNSAVEAVADAVSTEPSPLLGRAKDLGSAAVMLCIVLAASTWLLLLWP
ncbi:MAG: diacylglycerol kinase [Burkholderiaceae bacterium]|nr:diacylglycerol kinase [Burkholderiaceae bacterium]